MRHAFAAIFLTAFLFASVPVALADSLQFTLIPSNGDISGGPGSTIGWGYVITNQSSGDWLVTTGLSPDSFLHGTPAMLFTFPIIGPGQNATEAFNPTAGAGLYQLHWDSNAPNGFVNSGDFILAAQWWTGDPTTGGTFIADAPDTSAPYSAAVGPFATVPEPSKLMLLGIVVLLSLSPRIKRTQSCGRPSYRR